MLAKALNRAPAALWIAGCESTVLSRPTWLASSLTKQWTPNRTAQCSHQARHASSSSSTRWKARQANDTYAREAKVAGLKSRAAFKLLEINDKYRLFKRGDTVVDLGYAPGSWSQVAVNRTAPGGRVVGIDVIPAQPPRGVSTLQGDFLSREIRKEVRDFVLDPMRGRPRAAHQLASREEEEGEDGGLTEDQLEQDNKGIVEMEKATEHGKRDGDEAKPPTNKTAMSQRQLDEAEGRVVDVVLSDMMMNTSGMAFRDHAGSMDLCLAALEFCCDTLTTGGNFLCKFYQGEEDKAVEMRLKKLFEKVHRIKPDSSRKESKEAYFVGLRRRAGVAKDTVLGGD